MSIATNTREQEIVRLFKRIKKLPGDNACWQWVGAIRSGGYGETLHPNGKIVAAHRYLYELFHGKIPNGLVACHKCDNKLCVNPGHIFIGTLSDNIQDALRKGRLRTIKDEFSGLYPTTAFYHRCKKRGTCCSCGKKLDIKGVYCSACIIKRSNRHRPITWEKVLGVRVLDPDGWRPPNQKKYGVPITQSEFMQRVMTSTIQPSQKYFDACREYRTARAA